jgi:hypothetical protein
MKTRTARFFASLSLAASLAVLVGTAAGCSKAPSAAKANDPASLRADPSKMTAEGRRKMQEGFRKAGEEMRKANQGAAQGTPPGPAVGK